MIRPQHLSDPAPPTSSSNPITKQTHFHVAFPLSRSNPITKQTHFHLAPLPKGPFHLPGRAAVVALPHPSHFDTYAISPTLLAVCKSHTRCSE